MATIDLGKIKMVYRGAYDTNTAYTVDDVVQHTDSGLISSFICTTNSTGNAPSTGGTVHGSWSYLAKGAAGSVLTTQGDILYRDASGDQRLAAGTSGHVLTSGGSGANPSWVAASGGRTLQMKALWFTDQINYSSASWGDHSHPLGDGTIQITPKATGNLIRVEMNTNNTGGNTWQSTIYRYLVSTDSGSNWDYVTSSSDGGSGGHDIYNEAKTVTTATHNTFWHTTANTNLHMFKIQGFGRSGGGGDKINYDTEGGNTEKSRVIITEIDMTGSDFTAGQL